MTSFLSVFLCIYYHSCSPRQLLSSLTAQQLTISYWVRRCLYKAARTYSPLKLSVHFHIIPLSFLSQYLLPHPIHLLKFNFFQPCFLREADFPPLCFQGIWGRNFNNGTETPKFLIYKARRNQNMYMDFFI